MIWCLHGAVGMAEDWHEFAGTMAEYGHEVRAVDLWEFVEEAGCSLVEFGEALNARVRDEDADPVLVGYSMGGRLALHALLAHSVPWTAAVIVSAHPGLESHRERVLRMAADAEWAAQALTGDWHRFLASWDAQPVLRGSEGGILALGDRRSLQPRREAVARGFIEWSLGKQDDLRPRLRHLSLPLLWLTGQEDAKFTALAREADAVSLRHLVVEGAAHRIPWERPQSFATLVHQFLAQ